MRIAGTSYTESMANQINLLAGRQYKLQNQATTGQSITAPEDDPAGMVQALGLQADGATVAQYAKNISTLQNRSDLVASALQQLKTISDRIGELATLRARYDPYGGIVIRVHCAHGRPPLQIGMRHAAGDRDNQHRPSVCRPE